MLGMQAGGVKVRGGGPGWREEGGEAGGRVGVGERRGAEETLTKQYDCVCAILGALRSV